MQRKPKPHGRFYGQPPQPTPRRPDVRPGAPIKENRRVMARRGLAVRAHRRRWASYLGATSRLPGNTPALSGGSVGVLHKLVPCKTNLQLGAPHGTRPGAPAQRGLTARAPGAFPPYPDAARGTPLIAVRPPAPVARLPAERHGAKVSLADALTRHITSTGPARARGTCAVPAGRPALNPKQDPGSRTCKRGRPRPRGRTPGAPGAYPV